MGLTTKEQEEHTILRELQQSKTIPLGHEDWDRLEYLNKKQWHNRCINPSCTKGEVSDETVICPKCKEKIYKLGGLEE